MRPTERMNDLWTCALLQQYVETQQPLANRGGAEDDEGLERGEIARVLAQMRFEDGYPHKTTLLHRDHVRRMDMNVSLLVHACRSEPSAVRTVTDANPRFTTHTQLESALEQQSTLLRRCLEGHAQLRRSLQEEKAVVLEFSASHARKRRRVEKAAAQAQGEGMVVVDEEEGQGERDGEQDDDSHVVTMGDMHILKELQVANQNLRVRWLDGSVCMHATHALHSRHQFILRAQLILPFHTPTRPGWRARTRSCANARRSSRWRARPSWTCRARTRSCGSR